MRNDNNTNHNDAGSINGHCDIYARAANEQTIQDHSDDLDLLTYAEVAKELRVCQKSVETISRVRGEIPITRIGHKPFILRRDLNAYLNRRGSPALDNDHPVSSDAKGRPEDSSNKAARTSGPKPKVR